MPPDRPPARPTSAPIAHRATLASLLAALLLAGLTVVLLAGRPGAMPLFGIVAVGLALLLRILFRLVLARRHAVPPPGPR